jgi:hypothetical protein
MGDINDISLSTVLERIKQGKTTEQDAEQVKKWVVPDLQWMVVGAHFCLLCNYEKAKEWIAPDLRQELARRLTEDIEHE